MHGDCSYICRAALLFSKRSPICNAAHLPCWWNRLKPTGPLVPLTPGSHGAHPKTKRQHFRVCFIALPRYHRMRDPNRCVAVSVTCSLFCPPEKIAPIKASAAAAATARTMNSDGRWWWCWEPRPPSPPAATMSSLVFSWAQSSFFHHRSIKLTYPCLFIYYLLFATLDLFLFKSPDGGFCLFNLATPVYIQHVGIFICFPSLSCMSKIYLFD